MRIIVAAMVLVAAGLGAVCVGQTADDPGKTSSTQASQPSTEAAAPATQPADATTVPASPPADAVAASPLGKDLAGQDQDKAGTYPKPLTVPLQWQLEIELGDFRPIAVRLPDKKEDQIFWYLRYTVTNRSGDDRVFVPEVILYTDTGEIVRAGKQTPMAVFNKIKALYNDPLMKIPTAMTGKLLQGEDNAKSSVAIWPDFDPNAGKVSIFLGGLSGETTSVNLPAPIIVVEPDWRGQERPVTKDKLLLVKTLELQYAIPGEKAARRHLAPKLTKQHWVMR
jgi:hypothetical protein